MIVTRTGQKKSHPIFTRNEFGVVLVPGILSNGAVICWLPEHKNSYVAPRLDVRLVNLGTRPKTTEEEGRLLQPEFDENGTWNLKSRIEDGQLVKKLMQKLKLVHNDDLELDEQSKKN